MKQKRAGQSYDDEKRLKELARLGLKLLLLCYVLVTLMADKAAENLSKPSGYCNLRFCSPR